MLLYAVLYWPGHEIPGFTKKSCVAVVGSWGGRKSSAHNGHSVIGLGYKTGLRFLSTAVSMKGVSLPQREAVVTPVIGRAVSFCVIFLCY